MAIRPVDLQLAYLAAPVNAAVASSAQRAPQIAQEAAQVAFAQEVQRREESVDEAAKVERESRIHTDEDGGGNGSEAQTPQQQADEAPADDGMPQGTSLGFASDGEHFIDVVA